MKTKTKEAEEAPPDFDVDSWRRIVAEKKLGRLRPEAVVAAIQHIGPTGDQQLLTALMTFISDEITRRLRRRISTKHRNEGNDIIEETHGKLIGAILKPGSADGKGLRQKFGLWVRFRADDAIAAALKERERYTSYAIDQAGEIVEPADHQVTHDHIEQVAYVEHLLSKIPDPRKCLAFRMHMDGCPLEAGKGTQSIAAALGVSAKTAGQWIEEVQTLLKKLGVADDR